MISQPWIRDILFTSDELLTREAFVAKYFPRYVEPYRPDQILGFAVVRLDRYGAGLVAFFTDSEVAKDHASDGQFVASAWVAYASNGNVRMWDFRAPGL
jgi:hypothetical protein